MSVNAASIIKGKDREVTQVSLTNLRLPGTKVAILHMTKRGGGVIVNTASILGLRALPYALSILNVYTKKTDIFTL